MQYFFNFNFILFYFFSRWQFSNSEISPQLYYTRPFSEWKYFALEIRQVTFKSFQKKPLTLQNHLQIKTSGKSNLKKHTDSYIHTDPLAVACLVSKSIPMLNVYDEFDIV